MNGWGSPFTLFKFQLIVWNPKQRCAAHLQRPPMHLVQTRQVITATCVDVQEYRLNFPGYFSWSRPGTVTQSSCPLLQRRSASVNSSHSVLSPWLMMWKRRRCSTQVVGPAGLSHVTLHSRALPRRIATERAKSDHMTHWHRSFPTAKTFYLAPGPVSSFVFLTTVGESLMRCCCDKGLRQRVKSDQSRTFEISKINVI